MFWCTLSSIILLGHICAKSYYHFLTTILPEYQPALISSFAIAKEPVLNCDTALSLLRPPGNVFVAEDLQHSWSNNCFPPFEKPFLRIWDCYSGSQPDNKDRMKSRAPRQRLDTPESRKNSLATHVNHKYGSQHRTSPSQTLQQLFKIWRIGEQTREVLRPLPSSILILESRTGYLSLTYVPKWITMG